MAVVDTGVDYMHPDIGANIWTNPGEIPGNGLDDDANGYIDDTRGWDFTTCKAMGLDSCIPPKTPDADPMDGNGHGTHVSGTIAAVGNNLEGIIGVAPKALIMPVKGLDDSGIGFGEWLAEALVYAAANGADVINNSWGCGLPCPRFPILEDAVRTAHGLGAIVVFAAGNAIDEVAYYSPQNMADTRPIVVGASLEDDTIASFSNFGRLLHVVAPGAGTDTGLGVAPSVNILSLKANGTYDTALTKVGERYLRLSGTSMAAPHVSGLSALVLSRHPEFTKEQVRQILQDTAIDIGSPGVDEHAGFGRINASQAVGIDSPVDINAGIQGANSLDIFRGIVPMTLKVSGRDVVSYTLDWSGASPVLPITGTSGSNEPIPFNFNTTQLADGFYDGVLTVTATNKTSQAISQIKSAYIGNTLRVGWPQETDQGFWLLSEPVSGDIDGDGENETLVAARWSFIGPLEILIYAWNRDGSLVKGQWPLAIYNTDAQMYLHGYELTLGDLNRDGVLEVIATEQQQGSGDHFKVHVWRGDGSDFIAPIIASKAAILGVPIPVVADLNGDGTPEIIVRTIVPNSTKPPAGADTNMERVIAFSANGTLMWSRDLPDETPINMPGPPAIADVDSNGQQEIVILGENYGYILGSQGTVLKKFDTGLFGFDKNVGVQSATVVADFEQDGKLEAIGAGWTGALAGAVKIFDLSSGGSLIAKTKLSKFGERFFSSPLIGDVTGNRELEIVIGPTDQPFGGEQTVYIYSKKGILLNSFSMPGCLQASDVCGFGRIGALVDMDQDGKSEILLSSKGKVYAFKSNGSILAGWPKDLQAVVGYNQGGYPSLAYDRQSGQTDIIAGSDFFGRVYIWTLGNLGANALSWPTFQHDPQRTGRYSWPLEILTLSDSPDPFSPNGDGAKDTTTIKASFNHAASWTLQILTSTGILGRQATGSGTTVSAVWDGKNSSGSLAKDDTFTYTLSGTDTGGNQAIKSGTVKVDTVKPILSNVTDSPDPFQPSIGQTTTISFNLSESATVNLQAVTSTGTIVTEGSAGFNSGTRTVVWDGKDATGQVVAPNVYTYKLQASDNAGNLSSIVQGTVQVQ